MKPRKTASPNRKVQSRPETPADHARLGALAAAVSYGGNPEHKRNPGDFGLHPPSQPRQGKSLCDEAGIVSRSVALRLLREGVVRGLVSRQQRNGWPQNIWAVDEKGIPLESMLENQAKGVYHGYPMREDDPLAEEILRRWSDS